MNGLYMLGTGFSEWKNNDALAVTFQMAEDWNAQESPIPMPRRRRMLWSTAKWFADYVLSEKMEHVPKLIVEFTGVEDSADIDLMDRISDYFTDRMANRNQRIRFRFCTGLEAFQFAEIWKYLRKNENRIEVELILHDFLDIRESVLYLWEKGVAEVFVHMEPDEEADEGVLEAQLKELADYALENQLFRRCSCNFFDEEINGCGWENEESPFYMFRSSGILAIPSGKIYSLSRGIGCSYEKSEKRLAGTVAAGVDPERIRPFCVISDLKKRGMEEALQLERIRANEYYFAQLWTRCRIRREKEPKLQRMFIPLNSRCFPWISGNDPNQKKIGLTDEMLERSLSYCEKNGIEAVLIHPVDDIVKIDKLQPQRMRSIHIVSSALWREAAVQYANVVSVSEEKLLEARKRIYPETAYEESEEFSELAVWDLLLEEADRIGNRNLAEEGGTEDAAVRVCS